MVQWVKLVPGKLKALGLDPQEFCRAGCLLLCVCDSEAPMVKMGIPEAPRPASLVREQQTRDPILNKMKDKDQDPKLFSDPST